MLGILAILIIYAPEISFMPNYEYSPEKWHLLFPSLGFGMLLLVQLIWSIIEKIKQKKNYANIILATLSILLFSFLNNPKGDAQNMGYSGLIIVCLVAQFLYFKEAKSD